MPTLTIQLGQCGNQVGTALWDLFHAQANSQRGFLCHEYFDEVPTSWPATEAAPTQTRRCICIDSEPKVVKQWEAGGAGQQPQQQQQQQQRQDQAHMLMGSGGGCGNNWACGYKLGLSSSSTGSQSRCAWSDSVEAPSYIDQVMEGIRKEAEREAGVADFLLLFSLAGGTGSGTGSALLEALADGYPCSTTAAAVVAPGRAGGSSDCTTQSINACLALQHLSTYAHAVLLFDNQVLLDQINRSSDRNTATATITTTNITATPRTDGVGSRIGSSSGTSTGSRARAAAAAMLAGGSRGQIGQACLQSVNLVVAQALMGLLWPLGEADVLANRSSIRQLAGSIAADPLTKFLQVVHVARPDAALYSTALQKPWPGRIKHLAAQLPSFDPWHPTQPAHTSAAFFVARDLDNAPPSSGPRATASTAAAAAACSSSCWLSRSGACGVGMQPQGVASGVAGAGSRSGAGYGDPYLGCDGTSLPQVADAVGASWPHWAGCGSLDVHVGSSRLPLWDAATQRVTSSLTAAVRHSSIGSMLADVAASATRLVKAGAYMHWYHQYGCEAADIQAAAETVAQLAVAYE